MSHATRKQFTKNMVLARLADIDAAMQDIERFAEEGGKMPQRLRNMTKTAVAKNKAVVEAFKEWQP